MRLWSCRLPVGRPGERCAHAYDRLAAESLLDCRLCQLILLLAIACRIELRIVGGLLGGAQPGSSPGRRFEVVASQAVGEELFVY